MTDAPEVSLRPARRDDLPVFHEIFASAENLGEFAWFGWRDPGVWDRRWAENGLLGPDGGTLLIVRAGQGAGFVDWRQVVTAPQSFCWSIGIALLPASRGQGVGTQAQKLLVEYLFAHTQAYRVEAGTDAGNLAEQRALEKAGFRREGVLRGHTFRAGTWHDTVVYAILRDDGRPASGSP